MTELINPFTPSEIASRPEMFFGRTVELETLSRAVRQGSVAIQGPVGIGKSSLLARTLLHMDGSNSKENSRCIMAVGHSDIKTIEDASRLVLECLVQVDQTNAKIRIGLPNVFEYESSEVFSYFSQGRHLAALSRIIEDKAFKQQIARANHLIIAIDEADKCAPPLARLMRNVGTMTQLHGITNLRFAMAGVSPFYEEMIKVDQGIARFFYKTISLNVLSRDDAEALLDSKFALIKRNAFQQRLHLKIDSALIDRILMLSGGHPHLLQLLGSHIIEHEWKDPDGVLDNLDLVGSLYSICYETRAPVYEGMIHNLKLEGKFDSYFVFINLAKGRFPGTVTRSAALKNIPKDDLEWLCNRNIVSILSDEEYGIVDELLRVRVIMDIERDSIEAIDEEIVLKGRMKIREF